MFARCSKRWVDLLLRINRGPTDEARARYDELLERRRAGTLTDAEHAELIRRSDESEALQADRVAALADLARLRGTTLGALISE